MYMFFTINTYVLYICKCYHMDKEIIAFEMKKGKCIRINYTRIDNEIIRTNPNVGKITLKNRVMFPPMTTGYEERDGTIGKQSLQFYKRLAEGGVAYIVLGDVAPVNTVSPTPKLFHDGQVEAFKALADALHTYDCKLGIQLFHPEYDVDALAEMFKKGDMQAARAKLHHDMLH